MKKPPRTPLQRILREEGRRQNWLAVQVGKDPAEISRIVNGLRTDEDTQRAIADVLGREVDEVFPAEVEPKAAA